MSDASFSVYPQQVSEAGDANLGGSGDSDDSLGVVVLPSLKGAIESKGPDFHYQPKVDLATRICSSVEALARWQGSSTKLLETQEIVLWTERTGFVGNLTTLALKRAVQALSLWRGRASRLTISVNVSACDLRNPALAHQVSDFLATYDIEPSRLELELTETAIIDNLEEASRILGTLRDHGVKIALDDFGTGHAGLSYLSRLPFDCIKIGRLFIRDLPQSVRDQKIVRYTIGLAHSLGLEVVAEGVECVETLEILKDLGCDTAQGYAIAPPLPEQDLLLWIERNI